MSLGQCLRQVRDCIADPARGVAEGARIIAVAEGLDVAVIPGNITVGRWKALGGLNPALQGTLTVAPARAAVDAASYADGDNRNGRHDIRIYYEEPTSGDIAILEERVSLVFTALAWSLSQLPEHSQERGGTIYEVGEIVADQFGEFAPLRDVTTGGFSARVTVFEQSGL